MYTYIFPILTLCIVYLIYAIIDPRCAGEGTSATDITLTGQNYD